MPSQTAADLWILDPAVLFLNHGSYGACPRSVLAAQDRYRDQLEANAVRFMVRDREPLMAAVRARLAAFVGADPEDLVFVPNATTGAATVLASVPLAPGDELLTTSHVYPALRKMLRRRADDLGARVVEAAVPFPLEDRQQVMDAVLAAVTPATRLAVLDHITSQTALVFPIRELVAKLAERGVDTLVDGAHGPGQVDVDVTAIGAAYYTGNCHKWLCGPKGTAFLHVRRDHQAGIRPLVTSHGVGSTRTDRSRFQCEHDWTGTADASPILALDAALDLATPFGGWAAWQAANHQLAVEARRLLLDALDAPAPCPEDMLGAMATIPLPDATRGALVPPYYHDPLYDALYFNHRIESQVVNWPGWPKRGIRISAQRYNALPQYEVLARALKAELD